MKSAFEKKRIMIGVIGILTAVIAAAGAEAKEKKPKIALEGVSTLAILPFTYRPVSEVISSPAEISTAEFEEILSKKSKLTLTGREAVKKLVSSENINAIRPIDVKQAGDLGEKLKVDAVMTGHLKSFVQTIDEVTILYELAIVQSGSGEVLFSEEIEEYQKDYTRDMKRNIFASPEILTERAARAVAKDLVKRMK
ncbi:hypothetical protein JXA40_10305 [bacterium]|nr:hypothetical protein [candidate division CSSED10-310 bacterium]